MGTSLVLILCGEVIIIYQYDFVKCILQLSNFAAQPMAYKPDGAWVYIFSWKYPHTVCLIRNCLFYVVWDVLVVQFLGFL